MKWLRKSKLDLVFLFTLLKIKYIVKAMIVNKNNAILYFHKQVSLYVQVSNIIIGKMSNYKEKYYNIRVHR